MTLIQGFVTYVTCWWLVLFMVLPYRATAPENPGLGHNPSAPANPMIKKKIKWATVLAIIPTLALYLIVHNVAHAADDILTTKGGCKPVNHHASADVAARDGYTASGKQVKPANAHPESTIGDKVTIPLEIPTANYTDPATHNIDLSHSFAELGNIEINRDGTSYLNGQSITSKDNQGENCQ